MEYSTNIAKRHLIERYIFARRGIHVKVTPDLPREEELFIKAFKISKFWLKMHRPDLL